MTRSATPPREPAPVGANEDHLAAGGQLLAAERELRARLEQAISVLERTPECTLLHRYTREASLDDSAEHGIDLLSPVRNLLDLLPAGHSDRYPINGHLSNSAPVHGPVTDDAVR